MKKNNKKGFALIETLIVSIAVAAILTYIFIQFSTLKRNYNTAFKYDTVEGLYSLQDVVTYIESLPSETKQGYIIDTIQNKEYLHIYLDNDEYIDNVENSFSIFNAGSSTDNYAVKLFSTLEMEQLIVINSDYELNNLDLEADIIKYLKNKKRKSGNFYRIIAKYKDGSIASYLIDIEVM